MEPEVENDDFFDFMVLYELLFPEEDEDTTECLACEKINKEDKKEDKPDKD